MQRTDEVRRLQEHGCSVLCLGCPEGMLFGIDYAAWSVGPRFMGVKLVPPGLHYIYCSASAEDVGVARSGFFLYMKPKDVAVFRWDPQTEELVRPDSEDEEARYADGVRGFDFDANLGPYPIELSSQWSELTRHITPALVQKVEPVSRKIRSKRAEYDAMDPAGQAPPPAADPDAEVEGDEPTAAEPSEPSEPQPMAAEPHDPESEQKQPDCRLESNGGSGCLFFSSLPRLRKAVGATPAETTQLHMDRSPQLEAMVSREYGGNELGVLGELQLSYIAFLLGQNFDGFEQWRALLRLLCSCEAAVATRPNLFEELCRAFFAQLSQAPSDLFGDDLTKDNFLGSCAVSLLEICDSDDTQPRLKKRCAKLRELVQAKFGLSAEDLALLGEDAPQVVDEDGRDLVDLAGADMDVMD